jgi:hypothetical protein
MNSSVWKIFAGVLLALPCVIFGLQGSNEDLMGQTRSNMKLIALGTIMYTTDWDDVLPYAQSTRAVAYCTEPYMKNRRIWQTLNPNGGKIQFNMGIAGVGVDDVQNPAETPLFYETQFWPDGSRVVAFLDAHGSSISNSDWPIVNKALAAKFKRKAKPLPANWGSSFRFPNEPPPKP